MTGALTLAGDPTVPLHAATKQYVDNVAAGLDVKASVKAATTANITLSGEQTIDGVACVTGDRVLVKNQTNKTQNGIYTVSTTTWSRAWDFDSGTGSWGAFVFVEKGTANIGCGFVATSPEGKTGSIVFGTDQIDWTKFSEVGNYAIGNGLQLTGNTLSVKPYNGITVDANGVSVDAADGTITVDASGVKVGVIGAANISDGAIGTNKLSGLAVTAAKLGADVAGTGLSGGNGSPLAVVYGTSAGTACQGNDSRLHNQNTDAGTSNPTFYVGSGNAKLKGSTGGIDIRTNADDAFAAIGAVSIQVKNNTNSYKALITGSVTADRTLTVPDLSGTLLTDASIVDGGTF
jgi:hypothetical protein